MGRENPRLRCLVTMAAIAVPLLNMHPSHRLGLPRKQFGKPRFGGLDDLLIERRDQRVDRGVIDRFKDPVPVFAPQVLQHGEGLLSFLDDRAERNHDLRYGRLQFKGSGLWVGNVGDDKLGQPCEYPHGLREVLRLWLVEVEYNGKIADSDEAARL